MPVWENNPALLNEGILSPYDLDPEEECLDYIVFRENFLESFLERIYPIDYIPAKEQNPSPAKSQLVDAFISLHRRVERSEPGLRAMLLNAEEKKLEKSTVKFIKPFDYRGI